MKITSKFLICVLWLTKNYIVESLMANSWPVRPENTAGIMTAYGDWRDIGLDTSFHGGIDITQMAPDNKYDDIFTPVFPVRNGRIEWIDFEGNNYKSFPS